MLWYQPGVHTEKLDTALTPPSFLPSLDGITVARVKLVNRVLLLSSVFGCCFLLFAVLCCVARSNLRVDVTNVNGVAYEECKFIIGIEMALKSRVAGIICNS